MTSEETLNLHVCRNELRRGPICSALHTQGHLAHKKTFPRKRFPQDPALHFLMSCSSPMPRALGGPRGGGGVFL